VSKVSDFRVVDFDFDVVGVRACLLASAFRSSRIVVDFVTFVKVFGPFATGGLNEGGTSAKELDRHAVSSFVKPSGSAVTGLVGDFTLLSGAGVITVDGIVVRVYVRISAGQIMYWVLFNIC